MLKSTNRLRIGAIIAVIAVLATACGGGATTADGDGVIEIELSEFEMSPSDVTVNVGDTVTVKLTNTGAIAHEWMMGREVEDEEGFPDGYHENFFADSMSLEVMPMDAGMGMPDMDMDTTESTMAGMEDEMAHGFMVMRDPGEEATVTFTVTADQVGEWEMGCFVDDGAHYQAGMLGTFTVES